MKITVLGSGSAYGLPTAGGYWGDCDPANPRNRRLCPSILVEQNGTRLLFDMGPDFREQAEKHRIRILDAILYTHCHADHISGNFHLPALMRFYEDRNLPLYADRATRKGIEEVWWFQNDPKIDVEYHGKGRPYWVELVPGFPLRIGEIDLLPLAQYHGKMQSIGYRIGNFAYSTDLNDMPPENWSKLQGLDTWLVECDSESPTTMHSHLEKTLGWIERLRPRQAYLTHLDHTMDYERISARLPKGVALAYDGLVIDVP